MPASKDPVSWQQKNWSPSYFWMLVLITLASRKFQTLVIVDINKTCSQLFTVHLNSPTIWTLSITQLTQFMLKLWQHHYISPCSPKCEAFSYRKGMTCKNQTVEHQSNACVIFNSFKSWSSTSTHPEFLRNHRFKHHTTVMTMRRSTGTFGYSIWLVKLSAITESWSSSRPWLVDLNSKS